VVAVLKPLYHQDVLDETSHKVASPGLDQRSPNFRARMEIVLQLDSLAIANRSALLLNFLYELVLDSVQ
jgi:hypothetical protein